MTVTETETDVADTQLEQERKAAQTSRGGKILLEASPTIKPAVIKLIVVVLATVGGSGYLFTRPSPETQSVVPVVVALGGLVAFRYVWVALVLRRTRYLVCDDKLVREYDLLGKRNSRKVPLDQLRGTQLSRTRLESLLGVGSIQFLTGGIDQSLGFVKFEHVDDPGAIDALLDDLHA